MQINRYIPVLVLLGALSCSPSEPTANQDTSTNPATNPATDSATDVKSSQANEDTKPEVRYYLLSEQ